LFFAKLRMFRKETSMWELIDVTRSKLDFD